MSPEPVIGICPARERARWAFWDQTAQLVPESYLAAVRRAGAVALVLPVDPRVPHALLDRIDGLLLIGGADIDPAAYGAACDPATEATYPDRDAFEVALVREAVERRQPVLGICRGMQVLNVALGGTLRQDLSTDRPQNPHRRYLGSFEGTQNEIVLEPGSLAARAIGERVHMGCCHHHQGVETIGKGLVVSGRARVDGWPEALEAANGNWVLGVQWHAEAADSSALIEHFVSAAHLHGADADANRITKASDECVPPGMRFGHAEAVQEA